MDLRAELVSNLGEVLGTLDDVEGKILEVIGKVRDGLDLITTLLDDVGIVAAAAAVPGKQVRGILGEVGECALSGDLEEVGLQLRGGEGSVELGIDSGLKREVVGEKTGNVRRSHGGTGDGVDSVLGANPSRLDAEAGSEDVSALAPVGEVGTAVVKSRGTDSDSLASSSRRVVAGIGVVVTGSDGEVDTGVNGSIDYAVEGLGLATAKRHVRHRALKALALALLGRFNLLKMSVGSVLNALHYVGHGTRSVRPENLDGVDIGLLGDTVLLASNSAGAVGAVAIAINVIVASGDSLAPLGATLEVDVVDVGAGVDNVGIDTLTTLGSVEVFVESAERECVAVRNTSKTPGGVLLDLALAFVLLARDGNESVDNRVLLDEFDL